jgi:hypothetical protein
MPDIESEIRLKSSGADQVARDLQKIKEAADKTSDSLEGVQGDYTSGMRDPFSRAISQSAVQSTQTARDIRERQDRNAREMDRAESRELATRDKADTPAINALAQRNRRAQEGVAGVAEGVEQISQGGPGGLVGGIGGMLAKLFSGPVGWAALALGVGSKLGGNQAEKAFQFHRQGYLSGTVQRLGISGKQRRGLYGEMIESGIAPEMVEQYLSSLSQSGGTVDIDETVSEGIDFVMDLGAEASTVGRLAGMSQAMGLVRGPDQRNVVANREMLSRVLPTFGEQNINTFLEGMQTFLQGQQQAYSGETTEEMVQDQAAFITSLRDQGLTASSAVQLANQTAARDRQTSGFSSPTDMIALQAMRKEGEPILDTMARMEANPTETREEFVDYISGMSELAQVMAVRERYGVNVSGARRILSGELEGKEYEDLTSEEIEARQEERATEAVFSRQFFAGMQDTLLKVITRVGEVTGMFSGGDAAQIRLTESGAIGADEKLRAEKAAEAAQFERDVIAESVNVKGDSVSVMLEQQEQERGSEKVDYFREFGVDLANTNPNNFGAMDAGVSIMGMTGAEPSIPERELIKAAVSEGADEDKVTQIINDERSKLGAAIQTVDSMFGDDEGKKELRTFLNVVKAHLEGLITKIDEQTGITEKALREALGLNTVQSDDRPDSSTYNPSGNY